MRSPIVNEWEPDPYHWPWWMWFEVMCWVAQRRGHCG